MDINLLRQEIEQLDSDMRAALYVEGTDELRDDVTPEVRAEVQAKLAERNEKVALLETHQALASAARIPARTIEPGSKGPNLLITRSAYEVLEDRSAKPIEMADAITRSIEPLVDDADKMAHARRLLKAHMRDRDWARGILARSTEAYSMAFGKILLQREYDLTAEERTVLGVTTNANGKFLLPTHLDPTIILTNSGSSNVIRSLSRVVTLTDGQPAWNGVSSAGVTASWDGEVVEVSDDSPTFSQPSIDTERAQALAQASISAAEDIQGLASSLLDLFADAKDRLEGAAHATGNGTSQPKGIFTALNADTNVQITSTTAATIGLVDLHSVYRSVPVRWRGRSTWVGNPLFTLAVKALGTAVSASFTTDLTMPSAGTLLGRPLVESDDAPSTTTTTALDNELILGDFSQYVIVDRPGDMAVEYIPHLFNTTTNLPDGRRAWYATWRNGADVTTTSAFRMLVDKTSA
jgi:HK97 family phage major capsid protein